LPEDGFYEADPDVDTGLVHIVTPADEGYYPPPAEDTFAGRFTAPLTVDPRTVPARPERARLVPIVAGVAGVDSTAGCATAEHEAAR
jgi:hypothetical protein